MDTPFPPAVYRLEDFADIPLPPGYLPVPGADHLAIGIAGGEWRALATVLRLAMEESPLKDERLLDWFGQRLPAQGWRLVAGTDQRQEWAKTHASGTADRLVLETGRAESIPIMQLLLASRHP